MRCGNHLYRSQCSSWIAPSNTMTDTKPFLCPELQHLLLELPHHHLSSSDANLSISHHGHPHQQQEPATKLWKRNGIIDLDCFFDVLFCFDDDVSERSQAEDTQSELWKENCQKLVTLICELDRTSQDAMQWRNMHLEANVPPVNDTSSHEERHHAEFLQELNYVWNMARDEWLLGGHPMRAFILLVPYFERMLQQAIYAMYKYCFPSRGKKAKKLEIPKLSELIGDSKFLDLFGWKVGLLISMLTKLQGLSLRNITLHGYIREEHWYPGFTKFMFALMKTLYQENICHDLLNRSSQRSDQESILLDRPFDMYFDEDTNLEPVSSSSMPSAEDISSIITDADSYVEYFNSTEFVANEEDTRAWIAALESYRNEEYYQCFMQVLPLMEHGLRLVYVQANQSEERFLLATQDSLLVTMDIALNPFMVFDSLSKKNMIHDILGIVLQNALYDVFYWEKCIRIRGIICHGGCRVSIDFPAQIASYTLFLGLALCKHFRHTDEQVSSSAPILVQTAEEFFHTKYEPVYHSMSMLDNMIRMKKQISSHRSAMARKFISEELQEDVTSSTKLSEEDELVVSILKPCKEKQASFVKDCDHLLQYLDALHVQVLQVEYKQELETNLRIRLPNSRVMYSTQVSEASLKASTRMREILHHVNLMRTEMDRIFFELHQKVVQRKASQKKKENLSMNLIMTPCMAKFCAIVREIVLQQYQLLMEEESGEGEAQTEWNLLTDIYNATCSVGKNLESGKMRAAFETVVALTVNPEELKALLPEFAFQTLKKKVRSKLYTPIVDKL